MESECGQIIYKIGNYTELSIKVSLLFGYNNVFIICFRSLAKMSAIATIERPDTCEDLTGLNKRQIKICKKHLEVMDSVKSGAALAIVECGIQFRTRRWNCSTLHEGALFGNVLNQGNLLLKKVN